MNDPKLTQLIREVSDGRTPQNDLVNAVYSKLHAMARNRLNNERRDCTIQATSLANEAFMEVADHLENIQDTHHYFAAVAQAMQRLLVSHARHRLALKRGGGRPKLSLDAQDALMGSLEVEADPEAILRADAFLEAARALSPRKQEIMRLRYFGCLTYEQIAQVVGVDKKTVERDYKAIVLQMSAWHADNAQRGKDTPKGDAPDRP